MNSILVCQKKIINFLVFPSGLAYYVCRVVEKLVIKFINDVHLHYRELEKNTKVCAISQGRAVKLIRNFAAQNFNYSLYRRACSRGHSWWHHQSTSQASHSTGTVRRQLSKYICQCISLVGWGCLDCRILGRCLSSQLTRN